MGHTSMSRFREGIVTFFGGGWLLQKMMMYQQIDYTLTYLWSWHKGLCKAHHQRGHVGNTQAQQATVSSRHILRPPVSGDEAGLSPITPQSTPAHNLFNFFIEPSLWARRYASETYLQTTEKNELTMKIIEKILKQQGWVVCQRVLVISRTSLPTLVFKISSPRLQTPKTG